MAKKTTAKKRPPDCSAIGGGEVYHGNMMYPRQFEELLSAIEGIKIDPSRISLVFPDDFWRKFWAGCFMTCGHFTPEMAIKHADEMAKKFREGR